MEQAPLYGAGQFVGKQEGCFTLFVQDIGTGAKSQKL